MNERYAKTKVTPTAVSIRVIDEAGGVPADSGSHIRVRRFADPENPCKRSTAVECRFQVAGYEVFVPKNCYCGEENHEDVLNWAVSFARLYDIDTIYGDASDPDTRSPSG